MSRIDHIALNAIGLEQADKSAETIEGEFVDRLHFDRRCNALLGSCFQARKEVRAVRTVPAGERVFGHFLAAGGQRRGNPGSNNSALTRRTKWRSQPDCRSPDSEDSFCDPFVLHHTPCWRRRLTEFVSPICIGSVFLRLEGMSRGPEAVTGALAKARTWIEHELPGLIGGR